MYRAAFLMERMIEDDFIEIAERELGELQNTHIEFEETEDDMWRLKESDTPEQQAHNRKVFARAREIEEQMWEELWSILEGQKMSHFEMFQDKAKDKENAWDNWFDGSDLRGWWD